MKDIPAFARLRIYEIPIIEKMLSVALAGGFYGRDAANEEP
jgi:hypothetical protein